MTYDPEVEPYMYADVEPWKSGFLDHMCVGDWTTQRVHYGYNEPYEKEESKIIEVMYAHSWGHMATAVSWRWF
jgi:hypothetical protein